MSTSGWVTMRWPTSPAPVTTLSTPGGRISLASSASRSVRERRRLGRLEDDRVAGRQRGADLPDRHQQRVVPGRDLGDDADGLAPDHRRVALEVLARGLALQAARGAGEEAQVVDASPASRRASSRAPACRRCGPRSRPARRRAPRRRRRASAAPPGARAGVVFDQLPNAPRAAATARSTSSGVATGTSAIVSPVAGLSTFSMAAKLRVARAAAGV